MLNHFLDLYLVLYSRITQLVQAFPCPFIADEQTESISVPDPLILDAPLLIDIPPSQHSSAVRFSTLVFKEVAHSVTALGRSFYNPSLTLIKLFWMDSDLAVHESTFTGPRGDPEEPDSFRESSILRLRRRYAPTAYVRSDDNFVVDDCDESATQQTLVPRCEINMAPLDTISDLQWTLDFSAMYDIATRKIEIPRKRREKRQRPNPRTLDGLLVNLQSEMKNGPIKQNASQTMVELSDKRLLAEGLDESADDVKRLISTLLSEQPGSSDQCRYMVLPVQSSNDMYGIPAKLSGEADRDLLYAYDRMVDDWMSTLPWIIPVPTRLMKEKLIRGVAADLILSRLIKVSTALDGIIISEPAYLVDDQINEKAVAQNKYLHSSHFSLSSSQNSASQSSMANSRLFGSRRDSFPVQQSKYAAVPVLSGLSTFTTFKTPRPTPRNVTTLLSHWSVGSNPHSYVWERIEDEETRRSSRANTPRNRRKKRSQTRDQSLPPTPAVPMVRTWGSQPVAPPRINITSSQPTMDSMPMTQMERGIFGGRELKKPKRKKKRAAGF